MLLNRRRFLKGVSVTGALIRVGLPPLAAMFNSTAPPTLQPIRRKARTAIDTRFLIWFNGNGIPERYWIPRDHGRGLRADAVPRPLLPVREYVHVLSGIDNVAADSTGRATATSAPCAA